MTVDPIDDWVYSTEVVDVADVKRLIALLALDINECVVEWDEPDELELDPTP